MVILSDKGTLMSLPIKNTQLKLKSSYKDFVVYNMRTGFNVEPKEPKSCPFCKSALISSTVKRSSFAEEYLSDHRLIPIYYGTYSYACPACEWWCVREKFALCELENATSDFLITGVQQRWDVSDWLELAGAATEFTRQDKENNKWLFENVLKQEQSLIDFMNQNGLPIQTHYLGSGQDEKGQFNLFVIQKNHEVFLIILNQALSGWIDFEMVEIVIGVIPSVDGSTQEVLITSSRQIQNPGKKTRIKSRTRKLKIVNKVQAQLIFPNDPDQNKWTWDRLSEVES
jgi:hypothetical protein